MVHCSGKQMRYSRRTGDIASQVPEAANDGRGVTKSPIKYAAYLTNAQLKQYLTISTENDLLDCDFETQTFKTTEKGLMLLNAYNQTDAIVKKSSAELMLEEKNQQQHQSKASG